MIINEIATKQDLIELENRLKALLAQQFELIVQEQRLQNLKSAVADERLTKRQVMNLLKMSSNTIDKLERSGQIKAENWGDGKKRVLRYPKSQFSKFLATAA